MAQNGGPTAKQQRLIGQLLAQPTTAQALEAAGVSETTLRRWRTDPVFVAALDAARRQLFTDGFRMLVSQQIANLAALVRLRAEAEKESDQLRAAVALESALVRRYELLTMAELEARVSALEASSCPAQPS
jgi:hypothetical protein